MYGLRRGIGALLVSIADLLLGSFGVELQGGICRGISTLEALSVAGGKAHSSLPVVLCGSGQSMVVP